MPGLKHRLKTPLVRLVCCWSVQSTAVGRPCPCTVVYGILKWNFLERGLGWDSQTHTFSQSSRELLVRHEELLFRTSPENSHWRVPNRILDRISDVHNYPSPFALHITLASVVVKPGKGWRVMKVDMTLWRGWCVQVGAWSCLA